MSETKSTSGGIGFCGLLTIAFIVLKLCNVVIWSWWWVLSPLWIPVGLVAVGAVICLPFWIVKHHRSKKKLSQWRKKLQAPTASKWEQRLEDMRKAQALRK
jgi:Flp pilus assembly protein TadB